MKKRLLCVLLSVLLFVGLLPAGALTASADDDVLYELWIDGVQATSRRTHFTGTSDKAVYDYDPALNVLTVKGEDFCQGHEIIRSKIKDLTIRIDGEVTLTTSRGQYPITSTEDLTIEGPGRLNVDGDRIGIYVFSGAKLTVKDIFLYAYGADYGIVAHKSGSKLIIDNAAVKSYGTNGGIRGFGKGINLINGSAIADPAGGSVNNGGIVDAQGNYAKWCLISPVSGVLYDLYVAGVRVTSRNKDRILGDGTASYDPATNTLTLDNFDSTHSYHPLPDIVNGIDGLTVNVKGECALYGRWGGVGSDAIVSSADVTITGEMLYLESGQYGIHLTNGATLTVDDLTRLWQVGQNSVDVIRGEFTGEKLVVTGSSLRLDGSHGAVYGLESVSIEGGVIDVPQNARISGGQVLDESGQLSSALHVSACEYDLWIAGKRVTYGNREDVLKNGAFSYDPDENVLTVKRSFSYDGDSFLVRSAIAGLTVYAEQNATLENSRTSVITVEKDLTITGPGLLHLKSNNWYGISVSEDCTLTVDNARLYTEGGQNGIYAQNHKARLIIRSSSVHARSTDARYGYGAIGGFFGGFTLDNCAILSPAGAFIDTDYGNTPHVSVPGGGFRVVEDLIIDVPQYYDLYVGGVRVTSANAFDVTGDGAFAYDSVANVLTVNGDFSCRTDVAIANCIPGLTLYVNSDVTISSEFSAIRASSDMTITGPGKLSLRSSNAALYVNGGAALTVKNANLDARGKYGIAGNGGETITVEESSLHASGNSGAICGFASAELVKCYVTAPSGAEIRDGALTDGNGTLLLNITIDQTFNLTVAGETVTCANAEDILGNGVFSYDRESNVLTVSGDCEITNNIMIRNGIEGLTVRVAEDSALSAADNVIVTNKDMTITGPGKLTLTSSSTGGILVMGSVTLTLENADVDITAAYNGIIGMTGSPKLVIAVSDLHAVGGSSAVSGFSGGITLDDVSVSIPDGGAVTGGAIADEDGNTALEARVGTLTYDLYIAGRQVTAANKDDVLGDGFVFYDPETNTLTLHHGVKSPDKIAILNHIPGLTVYNRQWNYFFAGQTCVIATDRNMVLTGRSGIEIESGIAAGIVVLGGATLEINNLNLTISGSHGIVGTTGGENLIIRNCSVSTDCTVEAIFGFADVTLFGSTIALPENGRISNGAVVDAVGGVAQNVTIERLSEDESYHVLIAGEWAASYNAWDVLGDGTFEYDRATNTLFVKKSYTHTGVSNLITNFNPGLTICIENSLTLTCEQFAAVSAFADLTITGKGKLTLISEGIEQAAIEVSEGRTVTLDGIHIETQGDFGFKGNASGEKLVIRNTVGTVNGDMASVYNVNGGITYENCRITSPDHFTIQPDGIYDNNLEPVKQIVIGADTFELIIAGKKVDVQNAGDVLGDGVFSYDPESNILSVHGDCEILQHIMIWNHIPDLTVLVEKDSCLSTSDNVIVTDKDMTITGNGKLTLISSATGGILVMSGATLTLDAAYLDVIGRYRGITLASSRDRLIVHDSLLFAEGSSAAVYCAENSSCLTVVDCVLIAPENGVLRADGIFESDGVTPAAEIMIGRSADGIFYGDIDGDGTVNISDVSALLNILSGLGKANLSVCDLNEDGNVNISDVSALLNFLAGI